MTPETEDNVLGIIAEQQDRIEVLEAAVKGTHGRAARPCVRQFVPN